MSRARSAVRIASITLVSTVIAGCISLLSAKRDLQSWSIGTAYAAFFLVAIALVLGPINVIRAQPNPVHSPLRRDVGISGGLMAILHTALGLQVHMGGNIARYFFRGGTPWSAEGILFLGANWIGLASALILACVTVISNNPSLRSLGLRKWKNAQRFVYPAAFLAAAHGFAYQALEKRLPEAVALIAIVTLLVFGLQLVGYQASKRKGLLRSA